MILPKNAFKKFFNYGKSFFLYLIIPVFLTLGLSISFQSLLAAWTAPSANPPNSNAEVPINAGTTTQTKTGDLGIGGNFAVIGNSSFTGRVGIGTAAPGAKLDVIGTIRADNGQIYATDSATPGAGNVTYLSQNGTVGVVGTSYYSGAPTPLTFTVAAVEKMRIDTAGNVGIGTASPLDKLELWGSESNTALKVSYGTNRYLRILAQAAQVNFYSNSGVEFLRYDANAVATMLMPNGNGNVGIGTTNPSDVLHLNASGGGGYAEDTFYQWHDGNHGL